MKATKPGLGILQSFSVLASLCVKDIEPESVNSVRASVFASRLACSVVSVYMLPTYSVTKGQRLLILLYLNSST